VLLCFNQNNVGKLLWFRGFLLSEHWQREDVPTIVKSPTHHFTLTSLRQPGLVGSSPSTSPTSLYQSSPLPLRTDPTTNAVDN